MKTCNKPNVLYHVPDLPFFTYLSQRNQRRRSMDPRIEIGLLLLGTFAGLWSMFYARRAFQNNKKILDKLGR